MKTKLLKKLRRKVKNDRSQFNKIIAKKYFTKELNRINKLIP